MPSERPEPRFAKRLPCRLAVGANAYGGMVLNVSRTGVFVQTTAAPRPGEDVRLSLSVGPAEELPVDGQVVWKRVVAPHLRTVAHGGFGMRIRSAPEGYYRLLLSLAERPASEVPEPPPADPTPSPDAPHWRVRLVCRGTPRSRSLVLVGASAEDARSRALERLGKGWVVLETERL